MSSNPTRAASKICERKGRNLAWGSRERKVAKTRSPYKKCGLRLQERRRKEKRFDRIEKKERNSAIFLLPYLLHQFRENGRGKKKRESSRVDPTLERENGFRHSSDSFLLRRRKKRSRKGGSNIRAALILFISYIRRY